MELDIEKELKIYWYLGLIVLIIYGLWLFISPESWVAVNSWPYYDPVASRYVGATFIAWAIIMVRLLKDIENWEKIENWVLFGAMSNILYVIVNIVGIVVNNVPLGPALISLILGIFFGIVGMHIWIQKRK